MVRKYEPVFPKRPLEGKPSEAMMMMIEMFKKLMPEGVTAENEMTEANIAEKRVESLQ